MNGYGRKKQGTRFFDANRRPLNNHENILVFSNAVTNYYPQKTEAEIIRRDTTPNRTNLSNTSIYSSDSNYRNLQLWKETGLRYPKTVQKFSNHNGCIFGVNTESAIKHPSKKPTALIEYLIKTYTLEGELILDNTAGSGTLAIAAINTNRRYICIEKDEHYFEVMRSRIEDHSEELPKNKPVGNEYIQLSLFNF